jgi:hypothetical protein
VKGWTMIFQANGILKWAGVTILISDKILYDKNYMKKQWRSL